MRTLRTLTLLAGTCVIVAGCSSSEPSAVVASESTVAESISVEASAEPSASDETLDFPTWYADIDAAIDTHSLEMNTFSAASWDRLANGERDFVVIGEDFGATAEITQGTLDTFPAPLGDPDIDPLHADLVAALEEIVRAGEAGAEIYAADPEGFAQVMATFEEPGNIFTARDQAGLSFQDACLALSEAATALDEAPLDCFGEENQAEPETASGDSEVLEVGDSIDLQLGEIALTYEATVNSERADWDDDWLAVNDEPGFERTWWLGMPEGLADPAGGLAMDTVLEVVPFTLDLDPWLASLDAVSVLGTGEDTIGGLPARYWDVSIDTAALSPQQPPIIALVRAEFGAPVGGIQLPFEAAWRMWSIDHPAGPVLYLQTAFLDSSVWEAFDNMTEADFEAGNWPTVDPQLYIDALAGFDGYKDGLTFQID